MYYSLWDFLQEEITPEIKLLTRNLDFQTVPIESISVQELPVDDFIQKDDVPVCRSLFSAFFAFAHAVGVIRKPNMQKIHIVLLFGVIRTVACHVPARFGIGKTYVCVKRNAAPQAAPSIQLCQILERFFRND